MKSNYNLIAVAAMLLLSVSCGRKSSDATGSNDVPFPFVKLGNEWVYGMYNENNELSSDSLIFKIISEESETCFKTNFHNYYDSYWYADGEVWKTHTNESGEKGFIALYKDTYVGQKWEIKDGEYTMETLSVSETVTVPAGVFENCIKVAMSYKETDAWYQNFLFSTKFGLIKREIAGDGHSMQGGSSMQLISKNF